MVTRTSLESLNILIVDDEPNIRRALQALFMPEGHTVFTAENGQRALEYAKSQPIDVLICDLIMPGLSGVEVLQQIKRLHPNCVAIILTAYGTIRSAVEATRCGAFDYLQKPFDIDEIKLTVKRALEYRAHTQSLPSLPQEKKKTDKHDKGAASLYDNPLRCISPAMQEVYDIVERAADTRATVLITGESGTGKELIARALHEKSSRASGPFIAVSCAALPETLLESELFGHEKNAFTGATTAKPGRFELAHNGTLFLDEIGDIPPLMQVKLLRVLQTWEFERVGATKTTKVDVRLIAATNHDLDAAVKEGKFRQDLYFRLNIVTIHVPPLRERREDIVPLARHFLARFSAQNRRQLTEISPEVEALFLRYSWPGNVRELENTIERAVVLADPNEKTLSPALLPASIRHFIA
ncbi:sigma-54-dependent transcriptional regulator [Chthonomonas calidirosea]|uniref:sigma-54-dependent transcriptional regulator n=1 Tax=Chthonomonas calidirosea TaxID=454171 RepID=UPI0006EC4739|nr:sigma-54 dependent transcriptional regulator [Chthonomonas calidirosea]CEK16011.1 response regulator with CheY-like receiver, AAA-type ATPase, and DNA-binding domains [Chthonomonas calidirosea]